MTQTSNGGPLHPTAVQITGPGTDPFTGAKIPEGKTNIHQLMGASMADYFAAEAMSALIAMGAPVSNEEGITRLVRAAYSIGMAMSAQKEALEKDLVARRAKELAEAAPPAAPLTLADLLPASAKVVELFGRTAEETGNEKSGQDNQGQPS